MRRSAVCTQHPSSLSRSLCAHRPQERDSPVPADGGDPATWRAGDPRRRRLDVPHEAHAQLRGAVARGVRILELAPRPALSPAPRHPGRSRDGGYHSGDGVRQSRRALRNRRSFLAQSADREPAPYGEYLPRAQGEDVVSGKFTPEPLSALATNCLKPTRACSPRQQTSSALDATFRTSSSPSSADNSSSCSPARKACSACRSPHRRRSRAGRLDRRGCRPPPHYARSGQDPACASYQSLRRFTAPTPWPPARALRLASASAPGRIPTRPSGVRKRERPSFSPAQPRALTTCTA